MILHHRTDNSGIFTVRGNIRKSFSYGAVYIARLAYAVAGEEMPEPWREIAEKRIDSCHFEFPGSTHHAHTGLPAPPANTREEKRCRAGSVRDKPAEKSTDHSGHIHGVHTQVFDFTGIVDDLYADGQPEYSGINQRRKARIIAAVIKIRGRVVSLPVQIQESRSMTFWHVPVLSVP
mgnify:CR=1 FL=1